MCIKFWLLLFGLLLIELCLCLKVLVFACALSEVRQCFLGICRLMLWYDFVFSLQGRSGFVVCVLWSWVLGIGLLCWSGTCFR